jgi:hypothetical protein
MTEHVIVAASREEYLARLRRALVPDPLTGVVEPDGTVGIAMLATSVIRKLLHEDDDLREIRAGVSTAHLNVLGIMFGAALAEHARPDADAEILRSVLPLIEGVTDLCREGLSVVEDLEAARPTTAGSSAIN